MADATELNRLFWHSRRGMLELDVLLVPFVKEVYPSLDAEDQARRRSYREAAQGWASLPAQGGRWSGPRVEPEDDGRG